MESDRPEFVKRLDEWQARDGLTQRALAAALGCHESLLSQYRAGTKRPGTDFMRQAIARAPEPWKSALKQARQADQEAADAAVAIA